MKQLNDNRAGITADFEGITNRKFICTAYLHGNIRHQCKIWIGIQLSSEDQILYYEGTNIRTDADSPINENISVESDDNEMYLSLILSRTLGFTSVPEKANPTQIAEALWRRFIQRLETR